MSEKRTFNLPGGLVKGAAISVLTLLMATLVAGCGPQPPVPYQQLQVQDSEASEGFDVYMFVSVNRETSAEGVRTLLEWFRDVKFAETQKLKVFVWNNPQAALVMSTGDLMGEMLVDREAGIDRIDVYVD